MQVLDNRCFASTWISIRLQISDTGNVVVCTPPQLKIFHSAQTYVMKTWSNNLFVINELRQKNQISSPYWGMRVRVLLGCRVLWYHMLSLPPPHSKPSSFTETCCPEGCNFTLSFYTWISEARYSRAPSVSLPSCPVIIGLRDRVCKPQTLWETHWRWVLTLPIGNAFILGGNCCHIIAH